MKFDKQELEKKIRDAKDLSNEDKSNLLQLLKEKKTYGLVWEDSTEDAWEKMKESIPVLKEDETKHILHGSENPNHILIEGDNLNALTALSYTHEGMVDVIYIDPPYNTGNKDFAYYDDFCDEYRQIPYVDREDSYRHSKWLSFMEKRLKIARRLLSDKGVIFISIDDNEQANLNILCDEIFRHDNYEATITYVRKTSGKADSSNFVKSTEYILVYSKNKEWIASSLVAEEKVTARYNKIDADGRKYRETDLRKTGNADRRIDRPFMYYPFYYRPNTNELLVRQSEDIILKSQGFIEIFPIKPDGEEGRWRWAYTSSTEGIENLIAKEMPKYPGKYTIYEKDYIDKKEEVRTVKEHTSWDRKEFNSDNAMADFKALGFGNQDFPYPKSTELIKHILFLSNFNKGTILDFFAGSGTTMQAAMQLNAEDGGHRQCILVTNNENNICEEVTYERNKRVIGGYKKQNGEFVEGLTNNNLRYYKIDFKERKQSHQSNRELFHEMKDLLCIKEDIYQEQHQFGSLPLKGKERMIRYFAENGREMLMVYDTRVIPFIVKEIEKMSEKEQPLKIYIFADGAYPYTDDFATVIDKVSLVPMPYAFYRGIKDSLPDVEPKKEDNTELTDEEQKQMMAEAIEAENNEKKED
jgi:adenine-specific DNA-methyltransferase